MGQAGRHVILGAGPIGHAMEAQLRADGAESSLYSIIGDPAYDMPGTSPDTLPGADTEAVVRACDGAAVIYLLLNAHYVDWYADFPPRLQTAMTAASRTGARLVYHDNLYLYDEAALLLTEDTPTTATTRKGRLRNGMAQAFMGAVDDGRIDGVIGRSADMYGPGALDSSFDSTLGQRHFYPLLAGAAVNVLGDADTPHTYAYVDDVARSLTVLGTRPEAAGGVWHLPAAPTLSHRELLTVAAEVAGVEPRVRSSRISGYIVGVLGRFQADLGEVAELRYQFDRPWVASHARFEDAFGADPTSHREALERTVEWYRANPGYA